MAYQTYIVMIVPIACLLVFTTWLLPVTLLVNTQPSFGYGLPLSIGLIDLFELSQLIDFGYSAYALPFIWAPPFLRFSRRKSSSSLFHPTLLTQELFISQLNLFF